MASAIDDHISNFRRRLNETLMSQDSEYDDDLAVPESLEIRLHEDGETVSIVDRDEHDVAVKDELKVETLPFSVVHNSSSASKIFIPGKDVTVQIVEVERSVTTHPLNPNLYTIEFQHGPFRWTVKKRYKHIQSLHNQLKLFKMSLKINFHVKRSSYKQTCDQSSSNNTEMRKNLPRFPNKPDFLVLHEQLNHRMRALENYFNNLLKIDIYKHHPETISFLQVSHLTFVADLGMKGKEGVVLKRAGSGAKTGCNFFGLFEGFFCIRFNYICNALCGKWHKRHLIVKDSFIAHVKPNTYTVKSVILMDQAFEVSAGMYSTGLKNGIQIMNLNRHMVIKCWTRRQTKEWLEYIQQLKNTEGKAFTQANPHKSFVPVRESTPASWFVDGATYMSAVADAMEHAKEEIFIADWWLSPEIYLKRPAQNNDYWRLDKILERKAKEGVKIFVMIYKEVQMALGIDSFYSKQRLVEKCPENIKVFRHPDHAKVGVFFWAHHEKIVVVDQTVAFLGGIDLCYGRWDNHEHRLTDLGATNLSTIYLPLKGKDISTSSKITKTTVAHSHVIVDLVIGANTIIMATTKSLPVVPRKRKKRKPEPLQVDSYNPMLISPPQGMEYVECNTPETERKKFLDLAKESVKEKVDRVRNNVNMKKWINMVYSMSDGSSDDEDEVDRVGFQSDDEQKSYDFQETFDDTPGTKLWLGKDYVNFIVQDFNNLDSPYQDLIDRSTTPRMPWHDIGVMVQDDVALDVARHFIQRWNAIKMEKAKLNTSYPFLLPKSYTNVRAHLPHIGVQSSHDVDCQVLRSVSSWSAGFIEPDTTEQSIHEAYIHAISTAERYIYIENQFYITLATMDCSRVKNRIGETLLKRILRAKREGSVFRVFVMMPLLPAFEGEVGGPTGTALHAITHWNYASISRGKDAIINQLLEYGIDDPSEYITFHGLRTHSLLHGTMVTELIYVHSKLMIVDDKTVICGSANINDRSMIATRDSEIAIIIRDREFEDGRMNDMSFPCGKYAGSLRKHLFKEHLGLLWSDDKVDITDIVKQSFYRDVWKQRSESNTAIFDEVFHCIPSDKVTTFAALKLYQKQEPLSSADPNSAKKLLSKVEGHIVDFPLNFLCKEALKPTASSVEGMMPTALWT